MLLRKGSFARLSKRAQRMLGFGGIFLIQYSIRSIRLNEYTRAIIAQRLPVKIIRRKHGYGARTRGGAAARRILNVP
jgi:hypothetical protein